MRLSLLRSYSIIIRIGLGGLAFGREPTEGHTRDRNWNASLRQSIVGAYQTALSREPISGGGKAPLEGSKARELLLHFMSPASLQRTHHILICRFRIYTPRIKFHLVNDVANI